jgi:putative flippase GtrA
MGKIDSLYKKFLHNKSGFFLFIRAQLSSQTAAFVDNTIAFTLKKIFDIFKIKIIHLFSRGIEAYVCAAIIGQICGGLFVCFMNYRWTFKIKNIKFKYILVKFLLVWLVSVTLNTYFTFFFTEKIRAMGWLVKLLGTNSDDIFIAVKLCVALIVGFVWNFVMYKHFVYKNISFRELFHKHKIK